MLSWRCRCNRLARLEAHLTDNGYNGEEESGQRHLGWHTQAYQLGSQEPPQYALEGSIAIAGAGVSWLRDGLGVISSAGDSEAVARSVPDTGGEANSDLPQARCTRTTPGPHLLLASQGQRCVSTPASSGCFT